MPTAIAPLADPARPASTRWVAPLLTVALLIGAATTRVGFLARPFYNDAGLYAYMGKVVATGGTMYRDVYENKPPGAVLVAAGFWRVFGAWWPGYVLVEFAMTLVAAAVLSRAVARAVGHHAWWPTLLCAIVLLNFGWVVYTGFQLETIQTTFAACAAAYVISVLNPPRSTVPSAGAAGPSTWRFALIAGLLAGCAAMVKPTGMAVGGAFAVALVYRACARRSRGEVLGPLLAFTAGALVPTLTVAAWVFHAGIASEMPHLFRQIALYGSQSPPDPTNPLKVVIVLGFAGFPLLIRGWIFRRTTRLPATRPPTDSCLWVFAAAWFTLELGGILMQGRLYMYHFLPLAPAVALLYGLLPRRSAAAPVALGLLPLALISLRWGGSELGRAAECTRPEPLSQYLRDHTAPTDAIFADQAGRLLMETNRRCGSRYLILFYWVNYDDAATDYCRTLLADFEQRQPKYVVLADDGGDANPAEMTTGAGQLNLTRRANIRRATADLNRYVADHYVQETVIQNQRVMRRREPTATAHLE